MEPLTGAAITVVCIGCWTTAFIIGLYFCMQDEEREIKPYDYGTERRSDLLEKARQRKEMAKLGHEE